MTIETELPDSSRENPFSIEIDLDHPTCEPSKISAEFSLEPAWSWRQGAVFGTRTKDSSRWHSQLAAGFGLVEYEAALNHVVGFLAEHERFLAELKDGGGEIEVVLNHPALEEPKGVAFDLQLSPVFLGQLSKRRVSLRIRAWSENPAWATERPA